MLKMYSGDILFNALNVSTAVLYLSLHSTDNHSSSLNMPADSDQKSVIGVGLVTRFCSLRTLSRFDMDVEPQTTEP